MPNDLIYRREALGNLLKQPLLTRSVVRRVLYQTTTIDAVEVVRCKDCKSWLRFSVPMVGNCSKHCETTDGDDYCSHGERRDKG